MCVSKLHAGDEKFHPIYRHRFWFQFLVVQSLSRVLVTLGDPMGCSTSGFPVLHHPPQFAQTQVYWISDAIHLILCCLLLFLPSIFPSIRVLSNESALCISFLRTNLLFITQCCQPAFHDMFLGQWADFFSLFNGLGSSFWLLFFKKGAQSPLNTGFAASTTILSQTADPALLPHVSWYSSGLFSFCHPFNFYFLHRFWYLWASLSYFGTLVTIRKNSWCILSSIFMYVCVFSH